MDFTDAQVEVQKVVTKVLSLVPSGGDPPSLLPDDLITLELYLSAILEAVRQSQKRAGDPVGRSLREKFELSTIEYYIVLQPPRAPQHRLGESGWQSARLGLETATRLGRLGGSLVGLQRTVRHPRWSDQVLHRAARAILHEKDAILRVMRTRRDPGIVRVIDADFEAPSPG